MKKTVDIAHVIAWHGLIEKAQMELADMRDGEATQEGIAAALEFLGKVGDEVLSFALPVLKERFWASEGK